MSKKRWKNLGSPCTIAVVLCCTGINALAQSLSALPSGAPDAFELDRQRRDTLRQQREIDQLLKPSPRILPESPKSEEFTAGDTRFLLKAIDLPSSALLDMAQLREITNSLIGQTVSFKDLGYVVERVNALYIERNQVFARAILPPQRVVDGRVRIDLVEAKLDTLAVEGRERIDENWLRSVLGIAAGDLLDSQALDEKIQKFHRGSDARLALTAQPGLQPTTTALQLQVSEPSEWSGSASLSNEGSDSTGRNQILTELRWFSPWGRGDRASLSLMRSLGATNASLSWALPLSARWGTRLQVSLSRSRTSVIRGAFAAFDISGQSAQESLSLGQPVWAAGPWALDAQFGWTRSKSENFFAGVGLGPTLLHQSNLTLTSNYRRDKHDGSFYLGWQTASAKANTGARTQDAKLQWGGSYIYRLPEKASLVLLRVNGQSGRSGTPLGSQSMSLGGASTLRAFSPGTLSDASGYAYSAELHHALSESLGLQIFAEQGNVWGATGRAGLRDWGVTTEWRVSKWTAVNLTAARVMGPLPVDQGRVRAYARLSMAF